ncbi:MAG TPA: hypothetical protein VNN10_02190 [Dehalococcoidia bacterium]|nr:hypothetical protein [Dehalococcoidia bacterium]
MTAGASELEDTARALRAECGRLLAQTRLLDLLGRYGRPKVTGSYALDLMVWRDLDVELLVENLDVSRFFELGREIAASLRPARMSFRDERLLNTDGLPLGLYWGIHLPAESGWKIDLWAMERAEMDRRSPYVAWVQAGLSPETRAAILSIKNAVWTDPLYRSAYSSKDIYDAVLAEGVKDLDGFRNSIRARKGT